MNMGSSTKRSWQDVVAASVSDSESDSETELGGKSELGGELGGELMIVEGHAAETTRPVWGSTAAVSSSHPLSGGRLAVSRE